MAGPRGRRWTGGESQAPGFGVDPSREVALPARLPLVGLRYVRSDNVLGEVVEGELVLLNADSGEYFGLNRTGTRIWELLGELEDLDRVQTALTQQYPVDAAVLRHDLESLVAELQRAGLLRAVG